MDYDKLKSVFWELYLRSNSPSKWLLNQSERGKYHWLLEMWLEFLSDQQKVEQLFWNNDYLKIAPVHYISKLYEQKLAGSTTFEHRCLGYLCSFLMQSRSVILTGRIRKVGERVSSDMFGIKHGQVYG